MKRILCGLAIAAFAALPVAAQQATSGATSSSSASANVTTSSNATAYGGGSSVYIAGNPSKSRSEVEQSGTYTVRSAPSVQAPSMGSGHPCGLGSSIGLSIIGGGATGGATKVDDACLILQAGATQAGLMMVAARNSDACIALRAAGNIPANSVCTKAEKSGKVAVKPATARIPTCPAGARWDGKGCWMPKKRR